MMSQLMLGACKKQAVSTVDLVDPFGDGSGIALYKFDGDATEESGVYNGTATNPTFSYDSYINKQVFVTTATNTGYISFPAIPNMKSISFWTNAKIHPSTPYHAAIFGCNNFAFTLSWYGYSPSQGIYSCSVILISYTTAKNKYSTQIFDTNEWKHIVFNGDGSTICINGIPILLTNGYNGALSTNILAGTFRTGTTYIDTDSPTENFSLSHMRVFNKNLTQEEVTTLYNEGQ